MERKRNSHKKIFPVILAGGSGTRLWPLSRKTFPKQFIKLIGNRSLFQETLLRMQKSKQTEDLLVITNEDHYFLCQDQINELSFSNVKMILEPFGRNTAPAAAIAAEYALKEYGKETLLLILPSDHLIKDKKTFQEVVELASHSAQTGSLVTFGIEPTEPKTGYGYIQAGEKLGDSSYIVEQFVEKPNLERAKSFLKQENFLWNSGMFLFSAETFLMEIKKYAPTIFSATKETLLASEHHPSYLRLDSAAFETCPSNSIDYALMEKTERAVVIPLKIDWSDLGCWNSVAEASKMEGQDNVIEGNVIAQKCSSCFISAKEGPLVATLGLKDHIVVSTKDAILVADKAYAQEVKNIVATLQEKEHQLVKKHQKHHFSWGTQEELQKNEERVLTRLELRPQKKFFLKKHALLMVTEGEVLVEDEEREILLKKEQFHKSISSCTLINKGKIPAEVICIECTQKIDTASALLDKLLSAPIYVEK